jgi:hypothetical protein
MPDKLKNAIDRAANNFQRKDVRAVEPTPISTAEAMGLRPPALTQPEREGLAAEATLAHNKLEHFAAAQEKYLAEKAAYETERDRQIWAAVQARRVAL